MVNECHYQQQKFWFCHIFSTAFLLQNVQGVPQSQTAALSRLQEEEETDKTKQVQIEQTHEKH